MKTVNVEKEKLEIPRTNSKKVDWWNKITDVERAAIDKGLADVKLGKVKPHKEAKKLYEKWL